MTHHLAVLKKRYVDRVLRGYKTVECRLSRYRRAPFEAVAVGDILWLKQSSGPVRGTATVARVDYFHLIARTKLTDLRRRYGKSLQADTSFFDNYHKAKYATFIHLCHIRSVEPFRVSKTNRHAWVVLETPPVPRARHCGA